MNSQVRRLFAVVLAMFLVLGVAVTLVQVIYAPSLLADSRNSRAILQAAERDRGAIVVAGEPVAYSERMESSARFQRHYPDPLNFAHVTGYFSVSNMASTGIEQTENSVLEGETSALFRQRIRNLFAGKPRQGGGVELTIDPEMQRVAASAIGNRQGAAVAMDAKTGAVRALYSSPSFDPNPLASIDTKVADDAWQALEQDPRKPLNNRAIGGDLYAPGSVFKIITAAAMLENGAKPDTVLPSPESMTLPGTSTQLPNFAGNSCGSGEVTLSEAFARSCNTTFGLAVGDLPPDALNKTAAKFGFGQSWSIPLAVTPSTVPLEMDDAQRALSSIGQYDVRVTPLQMAMVGQAVANGGELMQPYLVEHVLDADNLVQSSTKPVMISQAVSAEQADQLTSMMVDVVKQPYGTGKRTALSNVQVAAKTGTAETGAGGRTNAWAVAFAPADDPQVVVSVVIEGDETEPAPYGAAAAAPIAHDLLEVGVK